MTQPFRERRRPFLTARWSNPVLLTFEAPAEAIAPHIHPSLKLDTWEGQSHVSVVAFDFQDTRLRGRRIPGYVDFPEINLRTYVRLGEVRGVTFLREFVPSRVVATVAKLRFNEPYQAHDMTSRTEGWGDELTVEHRLSNNGREHYLKITGTQASVIPPDDSQVYHFTEHRRGYGTNRRGELLAYRVEHPTWAVREIRSLDYSMDFGELYGPAWSFLNERAPVRTTFAVGSAVQVFPPNR